MPPAVIAAGIGVAGAVGGAAISSSASKKAGRTQAAASDRSGQLQQQTAREGMALSSQQFQQTRQDLSPWRQQGAQAANVYGGYLGLNAPQSGGGVHDNMYGDPKPYQGDSGYNFSGMGEGDFQEARADGRRAGYLPNRQTTPSGALVGEVLPPQADQAGPMDFRQALELNPQYGFLRDEGMRGIQGSAAARGTLQSGATLKALSKYNQNLAYGMSEGYLNRLQGVSGQGQNAAAQTGALGAQAAGQQAGMVTQAGRGAGAAYQQGAAGQAQGYLGSANAWSQGIQGIGNEIGGYLGYSSPSGYNTGSNTPLPEVDVWGRG